jgi:hypothetical protein
MGAEVVNLVGFALGTLVSLLADKDPEVAAEVAVRRVARSGAAEVESGELGLLGGLVTGSVVGRAVRRYAAEKKAHEAREPKRKPRALKAKPRKPRALKAKPRKVKLEAQPVKPQAVKPLVVPLRNVTCAKCQNATCGGGGCPL